MWLPQVLRHHEARNPRGLALRDSRRDVSWRGFARDVDATGNRLLDLAAGSRVLVLAANRVEGLETYVACAAAGMVAAPVNPGLTDPELAYIVAAVEPQVAVADAAGRLRLARSHPALPTIAIEELADLPSAPPYLGATDLAAPVAILHTSATTGRPKGVVVDQRSFQLNALSWLADV